jgi:undecaprenyl-phosphate 4-deoxy-4-formamido-L-arabinose transferase
MLRAYSRNVVDNLAVQGAVELHPGAGDDVRQENHRDPRDHNERSRGTSKYGLYQLIKLQMDLMTGFSFLPLRFLSWSAPWWPSSRSSFHSTSS